MLFKVGEIVEGKVSGITNFGLFVDIGEGKSGMVHISEVSKTYITDIREMFKENDTVKVKILNIGEDGKISLSIKRALPPAENNNGDKFKHRDKKPDNSYTWSPKKTEPASFEEMMNRFKATSDEKFSDLKRKNPDSRRSKRGANTK